MPEKDRKQKEANRRASFLTNKDITLDAYFNEWIARKSDNIRESTILSYKAAYARIRPALGARKVQALERRELMDVQRSIGAEYSRATVIGTMTMLHGVLKDAVIDGIIKANPAEYIKRPREKGTEQPARETIHRALTDEELRIFFKYECKSEYSDVFRMMLYTGMRIGEVCALDWKDIDFSAGVIHVRKTLTNTKRGQTVGPPKTKKSRRDIPINEAVLELLIARRGLATVLFGLKGYREKPVFSGSVAPAP